MSINFQGQDGFIWFTGVVEDRKDPAKLGRVRVRCIGYHTDDKQKIPTEDLPWAWVMSSIQTPSMNGMGHTPGFMVEGTWVVGFFRDAVTLQEPIIIGTLPGVPETLGDPNKGFNDPNRRDTDPNKEGYNQSIYPRTTGEPDTNRLARNYEVQDTIVGDKKAARIEGIRSASGEVWEEPVTTYNASYPKNHVFESESGHTIEYDDTDGAQRLSHYSSSGTFTEIDAAGNRVEKVVGNQFQVVKGTENNFISEDLNITVGGTLNIKCAAFNIEVDDNYKEEIGKNKEVRIEGTSSTDIVGIVMETYDSSYTQSIKDAVDFRYGSTFTEHIKGEISKNYLLGVKEYIGTSIEQHIGTTSKIYVNTDFEQHITGSSKILVGTSLDIDSGTDITLDGTTVNINQGTKGAARLDDTAIGTDPAHAAHGSEITSTINASSSSVKIGDGAGSMTTPTAYTEVTETDLVEVLLPEILSSEPKSSTVGGAGDDDPQGENASGGSVSLSPSAGRSNGAVAVGGSSAGSGSVSANAITPPGDCTRAELGSMSERYESNGNPAAINTKSWKKDRGGWSYGSYQIATKVGTMNDFLNFLAIESNGYTDFYTLLNNAGGNTGATNGTTSFKNKWKDLAISEETADRFKGCQHDFIQRTHYDVAVRLIKNETGIDICDGTHSNGLQDAVWSTAVQYGPGGARSVFRKTVKNLEIKTKTKERNWIGKTPSELTDLELITEMYDYKISSVPTKFKSSPNLWGGLTKRFNSEKSLTLANNVAPTTTFTTSTTVV